MEITITVTFLLFKTNVSQAVGVSFEKSTTEFCQGYNTPAQSSFLDTTKAHPMTGAIKTLGEACPPLVGLPTSGGLRRKNFKATVPSLKAP